MAKTQIYRSEQGKKQVLSYYESVLMQWHQPCTQISIETSVGDTFIIESGKKESPAILLIHGSGSNSAMWLADAMELSEMYHVFAIDIPGECGKSSENRPPYKSGTYSKWISEIVEKLGLNRVSIIACSLGGWIAMDFSNHQPERVEKLVLVAPAGVTQVKVSTILRIIITSMLGPWGFKKINKMVYGRLHVDQRVLEFVALIKKHYIPRTDVLPVLADESLQKIKASTLFIGGADDCFYDSKKSANRLNKNLGHIECTILEGTGHVLTNQTHRILQFLNS